MRKRRQRQLHPPLPSIDINTLDMVVVVGEGGEDGNFTVFKVEGLVSIANDDKVAKSNSS